MLFIEMKARKHKSQASPRARRFDAIELSKLARNVFMPLHCPLFQGHTNAINHGRGNTEKIKIKLAG